MGLVNIAKEHNLVLLADEIYDKILYDDAVHIPMASLTDDVLVITFNGLSKSYRLAGFRSGWIILSGAKHRARDFIEGIHMLSSMRLCANVPGQLAVQTALGGYQSIKDLVLPKGRLLEQRDIAYEMLNDIQGSAVSNHEGPSMSSQDLTQRFTYRRRRRDGSRAIAEQTCIGCSRYGF